MKINKLLIFVLIVFLIATVCVGCNNKSSEPEQQDVVEQTTNVVYDQEIAEDKYLKERISDATAIYYKSSLDGQYGDDRYLFEKTLLPKEYTELDYIQSTGSQSIDTGIKYADSLHFDLKFSDYTNAANTGGIFGTEGWMFSLSRYGATKLIWCTEQKKFYAYNSFSPYKTYTVQCGKEYMTINDIETIYQASSGIYGVQNITLFKSNTGYANVKLYYFKIYDGDTIVRNYIPCYRNYDKAVGLYDLVSKRFYCNSTETNFEQGNTITGELPNGYKKVDYIESTGTQRIKLDIVPKSTYKIESTFAITSKASNSTIWCARGETQAVNTTTAFYVANEGLRCDYGVDKTSIMTHDIELGTKHTLIMNSNTWSLDGSIVATMDYDNFTSGSQIGLFASHYNGIDFDVDNWSHMKLYEFKVYNEMRVLILNLIPCYRTADKLAGLYDVVNRKFYTNDGTGEFIVGSSNSGKKLVIPSEYQAVEYIEHVNPGAGEPSQHNRIVIATVVYDFIEARVNYVGSGANGGILISEDDNEWWKSCQGGGSDEVTMTPYVLAEDTWTNVTWSCASSYTGLKTAGWADDTNYWTPQDIKYGYIKTYNDSVMTGYFIPCYRKSDNVAGVYDKISGNFYTNSGTGSLYVGESIDLYEDKPSAIPDSYQQVEYIQSSGTQYIDTGYLLDATTIPTFKVVIDQIITKTNAVWSVSGIGTSIPRVYVGVRNDGKFGYGAGKDDITTSIEYHRRLS